MADEAGPSHARRTRRRASADEDVYGPAPPQVHPSIANLRGKHRAAHSDQVSVLNVESHQIMKCEWIIVCPRFLEAIQIAGLRCVAELGYIRLDHHLITALVERWSPTTNTFHLAVGEMTITLQDVAMILGLVVDGPPIIGPPVVGGGRRWQNWVECCDDLLGSHPNPDLLYHDPLNPQITAQFRMGQARSGTCVPLRWLRWTFQRDSYEDLNDIQFRRHVRGYILFLIGTFLLPDTSGSEVHLQYLPLLEFIDVFGTLSLGSAVLAHLYRELTEATSPKRAKISGCVQLLQIWSWERFHIGRPTLQVPELNDMNGYSVGLRWNSDWVRDWPNGNITMYRDEFDGLLQSQIYWEPYADLTPDSVDNICFVGEAIWLARVPLISWKRVEWHVPDRVVRQFGARPIIEAPPIDPNFVRVDGRGKADIDWVAYHRSYIELWENRRYNVISVFELDESLTSERALLSYMRWYKSWATLFLLKAPSEPPRTYYARATSERQYRDLILEADMIFEPFYGLPDNNAYQQAINKFEQLLLKSDTEMYVPDTNYRDLPQDEDDVGAGAGPSSYDEPYASQPYFCSATSYDHVGAGPSTYDESPIFMPESDVQEEEENVERRTRRPPDRYTPGSHAIRRRR